MRKRNSHGRYVFMFQLAKALGNGGFNEIMESNLGDCIKPTGDSKMYVIILSGSINFLCLMEGLTRYLCSQSELAIACILLLIVNYYICFNFCSYFNKCNHLQLLIFEIAIVHCSGTVGIWQ